MKYRSKPVEIEARQWTGIRAGGASLLVDALIIVGWVNAHGGEARYEPEYVDENGPQMPARIAVRTINGWAYAAPGHYIVKGTAAFDPAGHAFLKFAPIIGLCAICRSLPGEGGHKELLDFYPCDPEEFEKRWAVPITRARPGLSHMNQGDTNE